MRRPLLSRLIPAVVLVVATTGAVAGQSAAKAAGVVPGLTGAAARQAAGPAADRFRQLTEQRVQAAAAGHGAASSAAATLHTSWGITMPVGVGTGFKALQSVVGGAQPTNGGDFVYAPTALPPGRACMEITTAYTPSGPDLWAWDWCGGRDQVGKLTAMDSTFLATYTTTVNGHPAYDLDEHQTSASGNVWTAYLYNYQTHAWDTFYTSSGTYDLSQYPFGWDMFEVYTTPDPGTGAGYYCHDLLGKPFESSSVQLLTGSTWTPAAPGNSSPDSTPPAPGSSLDCPALTITLAHPNDDWTALIGGTSGSSQSYEAEAAGNTLAGQAAVRSSSGASGGALVGYIGNGTANYLQVNNVSATTAGSHRLTIYYAAGENRSLTVSINGGAATSLTTPGTGGWDTVGSVATTVTLTAGTNTVRIGNPTGWAPDVDRIVVS
ncbi:Carbohydrate binding family 6 [Catenulispora acidiphila DSM 44928]|uniref:Carbohydrate binding family 6 n=1 Tax=Catenulispora acidiphila (strain DSM 44928 / JCM 14897 / NBRC 102108 / NRRL B-24433 / ID139908) TaxID=479433 RepID=C7Q3C6_CATAD|nr:carbohydrate-binding protein [Catenulispora acidiphila]ACU73862.1 Carbohydrate binding family 6 [Catenulispora acidiphila DSM 44928]